MQTIKDKVTSTVKPVIESAIERGTPVLTAAVEGAISVVERFDPEAKQREAYFTTGGAAQGEEEIKSAPKAAAAPQQDSMMAEQEGSGTSSALNRLKVVTEDLLDLWLFEGSKGVRFVQASKAYQLTDPYVHYVEKYEAVKTKTIDLRSQFEQSKKKIVLFYDEATNFVGMLINVLSERQEELVAYISTTYSNVHVFVQDNYMRLDFNKDGSVNMEDMRANLLQFYEFLKSYEYLEASSRIKSTLYDQAVSMMQCEQSAQNPAAEGSPEEGAAKTQQQQQQQQRPVEVELENMQETSLVQHELDEAQAAEAREFDQKAAQVDQQSHEQTVMEQ